MARSASLTSVSLNMRCNDGSLTIALSPSLSFRHVDSPAKRLERIASEYNHMLYLVEKAGDLPFVRSLDPVRRFTQSCCPALTRIAILSDSSG